MRSSIHGSTLSPFGMSSTRLLLGGLLFAHAALSSCSCDDDQGDIRAGTEGILEASPETLSFSAATVEQPETLEVELKNVGTAALSHFSLEIRPAGSPFVLTGGQPTKLEAGATATLAVTYAPDDASADDAELEIRASDNQSAVVHLTSVTATRQLQCEPDPVAFGPMQVGSSKTVSATLRNIGSLPLTLTGLSLAYGDDVEITDSPAGLTPLGPDATATVELRTEATSGGTVEDTLRIAIAESSEVFKCRVTATTSLPVIDVPLQLDFGFVELGLTETRVLEVRNSGDFPLTVTQAAFGPNSDEAFELTDAPSDPVVVGVGEVRELEVTYTAAARTSTGTLVISSNDPVNPAPAIALLGRPSQPDIAASPSRLSFGAVRVEDTRTEVVTLFNNGNLPLTISSISVAGDAAFTVAADPDFTPTSGGAPAPIDPFSFYDLSVTFAPAEVAASNGVLEIVSDDPDSGVLQVDLHGEGLEGGSCHVTLRPDPVEFGLVVRGEQRMIPVSITNVGTGPCRFMGADAEGFFNTAFSVVGSSQVQGDPLAPGDAMTVDVMFFPTQEDTNSGTFEAHIEDALLPPGNVVRCNMGEFCAANPTDLHCLVPVPDCSIDLSGEAVPSQVAVIPGQLDLGAVAVGCASQAASLIIYNIGAGEVSVSDLRLEGCGDEMELRGVPAALPADVAGDSPLVVQVVYVPEDLGEDSCEVVIMTQTAVGEIERRVSVAGEGVESSAQVDTFAQVSGREVDVLFVLDVSSSMDQELQKVSDELTTFMATAELLENDYHIGVTHLGWKDRIIFSGRFNEAGELMGEPPFLTPETPNIQALFEDKVRLGDLSGGTPEAGLVSTMRAFTEPYATVEGSHCLSDADCNGSFSHCSPDGICGGRNVGFMREDASLEVVIVSDEEDQSPSTPDFYLNFFQGLKGFRNDALLHISVIVGADPAPADPPLDDMSEVVPCSGSDSDADAGRRYATVAFATGGSVGSICAPSFAPFLAEVGSRAFGLRREFILSRAADETTIVVRVGGQVVDPADWVFDPSTNSVIFGELAVPDPGQTIEVEYDARCFN